MRKIIDSKIHTEELPIFKFAIREDLKDCETSFLPTRVEQCATGWDVKAAFYDREQIKVYPDHSIKIPLGFRTFPQKGWWFELKPRSSSFAKKHLHCLYGTIDETYESELILCATFMPGRSDISYLMIEFGESLGQIIPVKRQEMIIQEISNEEYDILCKQRNATRGTGGFGSSDKK